MREVNAVTTRLDKLHHQWTQFVEDETARLLVWRAADGEQTMIDVFVDQEGDAELATTPDLFLQLRSSFAHERAHGYALAGELVAQYEQLIAEDAELAADAWVAPRLDSSRDDVQLLLRVLASFREHHLRSASSAKLAVWLAPDQVSSPEAYGTWLARLIENGPEQVRFVVVEEQAADRVVRAGARVRTRACELQMMSALAEVAEQIEEQTPDVQFAKLETQLGKCLERGDLEQAARQAQTAVEFAQAQGWPQLAGIVHMTLAAGYAGQQKTTDALASYSEAERCGALAEAREAEAKRNAATSAEARAPTAPSAGQLVRLHAWLGQGALLFMERAYELSAKVYEQAAELATAGAQTSVALAAYRLASRSRSELGEADAAWTLAMRGFQLGLELDGETLRDSTFSDLAEHLLHLTERHAAYGAHRRPIEARLTELLGADWRAA